MIGLRTVSHIFFTSQAIQEWRTIYWSLLKDNKVLNALPPGLLFGEHLGRILVVRSMRFDERTVTEAFRQGWQAAQFELTANQKIYERVGLWYLRHPGRREVLQSSIADLMKFKEDLEDLPTRVKDGRKIEGLIATTASLHNSKTPLTARALVLSLTQSTTREVVVQTDPLATF